MSNPARETPLPNLTVPLPSESLAEDDGEVLTPIKDSAKLIENACLSPDLEGDNLKPPPSSRASLNDDYASLTKTLSTKQMKELLMSKLTAIAEEIVTLGRNTESPQGTMLKSLDDSCVLFAVGEESENFSKTPSEKSGRSSHFHSQTPNEGLAKVPYNMKSPSTIDHLKRRLFVLKKQMKIARERDSQNDYCKEKGYVKSYSIDKDIVVIHPERFIMSSAPKDYSSPPSSRQEQMDAFKVLDLSNPEVWNSIYRKLQNITLKDVSDNEEEDSEAWPIVAVDKSAVVYMNNESESDSSSRDAKTPIQSKIPSRDEGECINSANNMQKLIMKLLEVKESEQGTENEVELGVNKTSNN